MMKRQAIETSIDELIKMAKSLQDEGIDATQKTLLPIINRTGMSDDWKFEKT